MSSGLNIINADSKIDIVQNNLDELHTLTINSIDNLGSELDRRSTKTDTDILLYTKAPINNPVFTGTISGISKSMVGLANVDNTSDLNKPISSAMQAALNDKVPMINPTFTGTTFTIYQLVQHRFYYCGVRTWKN